MSAMTVIADASERPYGLITVQAAVSALVQDITSGRNRMLIKHADESRRFRTEDRAIDLPTPLVVVNYDHYEPWTRVSVREQRTPSRRVIFARDGWACQYCDFKATPGNALRELTIDHVKPACMFPSRKAASYAENLTTACFSCNQRKQNLLPRDAIGKDGKPMLPRNTPKTPSMVQLRFSGNINDVQRDYVNDWYGSKGMVV